MDAVYRLRVFLSVARLSSFSAAARELGVNGPALSKQINSLESELGVRLFRRTTRHVSLTDEGQRYFEHAQKAVDELDAAAREIQTLKKNPTGPLKINAPMSFGKLHLAQPLATFAQRYPDLVLDLDFDDRQVDMLTEGYDLVVRIGALNDSSLIARKLADCPIILCASADYLSANGTPRFIEDLKSHRHIIYSRHGGSTQWYYSGPDISGQKKERGSIRLPRHFAANNAEAMVEAALAGLGVALLPIFAAHGHLQSGALVRVLPEHASYPDRGIYVVYKEREYIPHKVKLLIEYFAEIGKAWHWK